MKKVKVTGKSIYLKKTKKYFFELLHVIFDEEQYFSKKIDKIWAVLRENEYPNEASLIALILIVLQMNSAFEENINFFQYDSFRHF